MFSELWWLAFFGAINVFVWGSVFMFFTLIYLDYRYNREKGEKFLHYFGELLRGTN